MRAKYSNNYYTVLEILSAQKSTKRQIPLIIDYQSKSREELLSYGEVVLKPASSDNPESTREIL